MWLERLEWPSLLKPLTDRLGYEKVWRGAEQALGYPATWISRVSELRALVAHLSF